MKKINLSYLSNKQVKDLLIFSALGVLIIIFDFSFLLNMQWQHVLALGPKLAEARKNIRESLGAEFRVENFKKRQEELKESISSKSAGIIEEGEIPALLGEVSKLADKVNLKIMRMTPQKEIRNTDKFLTREGNEYYSLPISISSRGGYHAFGHFLNNLESSEFLIKVNNIEIFPGSRATLEHDIRLTILIFVLEKHEEKKT